MRLTIYTPPPAGKHAWFAWYPVLAYGGDCLKWVWLEPVLRQWTDPDTDFACWEYWVLG